MVLNSRILLCSGQQGEVVQVSHLNILSHAQVVALLARVLAPDVGCKGAEQAHQQLHADDERNLEVQEAIIRPCTVKVIK